MKDESIFVTVLGVTDKYENENSVEFYTAILNSIQSYGIEAIEDDLAIEKTLVEIVKNPKSDRSQGSTKAIIHAFDKFSLFELLVEYLILRINRPELFGGLETTEIKNGGIRHLDRVTCDNYKFLQNPFMHGHKLFFRGILWEDFADNPLKYNLKDSQILLKGSNGKYAYANLFSDDLIAVKRLYPLEERWYLHGKLDFNQDLKVNTISVIKVISDILDQPR